MSATTKEFCDYLRARAKMLASGEIEELKINMALVNDSLGDEAKKIKPSYIRMTMNRVAEIREIGCVKIRRSDPIEDEFDGFIVTLEREAKRRVFTDKDLPAIRKKANEKLIAQILAFTPDFSHLEDGEIVTATKAVAEYKNMIRNYIGE